MLVDSCGKFWVSGAYRHHTIFHMTWSHHSHMLKTRQKSYQTNSQMMSRDKELVLVPRQKSYQTNYMYVSLGREGNNMRLTPQMMSRDKELRSTGKRNVRNIYWNKRKCKQGQMTVNSRLGERMMSNAILQHHTCNALQANPVHTPLVMTWWPIWVPREKWYSSVGEDLHLKDFIFQAWMHTAHCATQRWTHFPEHDHILDYLIKESKMSKKQC